ncbi:triacylglycerol lipase [Photobacterium sp. 1_MG-2023]|uniref:esterase/lipase family protein n=1 Tax=Photobacterium sp. 1_MG-2023 TaxID=3062646 RepID=UPI0026E3345D|nr:alpha/beta hydrolase [Photobacterium sp. 1_MG-2023]MDO6705570.1 alpha/beta hydrolase [Photobacterium sp. 1_MG-2023]
MVLKHRINRTLQLLLNDLSEKVSANSTQWKSGLEELIETGLPAAPSDLVIATLNGVMGDALAERRSRLAQTLGFSSQMGRLSLDSLTLAGQLVSPQPRIVICVHGWCMNDSQWQRKPHDHGRSLVKFGYSPVYLRYNTGRHISQNGEDFALMLEQLVQAWPCEVKEIVLIGHSMGGLVCRSACFYADRHQVGWLKKLASLITLGSPHNGAPLAQMASWIEARSASVPYLRPFSNLTGMRSAGSKDLSRGVICHSDWERDPPYTSQMRPPLPDHVACFAIASCLSRSVEEERSRRIGDGLVPVSSALGEATPHQLAVEFPLSHQWIGGGITHMELLTHPKVATQIQGWVLGNSV